MNTINQKKISKVPKVKLQPVNTGTHPFTECVEQGATSRAKRRESIEVMC